MIAIVIYSLCALNLLTFIIYGIDKWKAKKSKWRISEASLLLLAVVGGSIGAWCGIWMWHHKTQHKKFSLGIPVIMVAQVAILVFMALKFHF